MSKEKHFDVALLHYEEAAALEPDSAKNHNTLGLALMRLGEWQMARAPLEHALTINPDFAQAHYNLGRCWLAVGNPAESANEFERALYIRPNYPSARRYLETALSRLE